MHAVESRRLGCPNVRADVLDRVVAQRDQSPVGAEARLDLGRAARRRGTRGEVLEPVLDPGHRHAEPPRGEPHQYHVREHGRLDPERATGVGWRQKPEPVALEPERGGGDAVEGERSLEVGPRRQPAGRCVPVRDDRVALDGGAGEAREVEGLAQDELRLGHRTVDVAVREAAVVHRRGGGCHRVEHGLERVVVHLDELRRVLREVAVTRDDDRDRLADVAHGVDRRGVLRDAGLDPGGKRAGQLGNVGPGQDADDAGCR